MFSRSGDWAARVRLLAWLFLAVAASPAALAGQEQQGPGTPLYPNTSAKDMDGDIPWRVQGADTPIPVIWIIKDADQFGVEVDEMKYVVLYDVSDGYDPPSNWDSPLSDHVVYYHNFNDVEISVGYWYWLTTAFENDGAYHGTQANGTPLTPAALGYSAGQTISFTLRLYGKDGFWPFYTDVTLDQDFKVHVGQAPLPTLSGWYLGDVHDHGWKTDNLYEYGEPTDAKALAAAALGLDFVTITDHSSDLSTGAWNDLGSECSAYSTPTLRLIRSEEVHANQGGLLDVRHLLAYEIGSYIEGAENGTYPIDGLLGGPSPANNITAQGGFAYAAHPTDTGLPWTYSEIEEALGYPVFVGLQVHNERNGYYSASDWSDDDDEYHPWGGDASIDPYNHDWTIMDGNWAAFLEQGLLTWDHLLSDRLSPVRKIFISGGSDSHGAWNYNVFRTTTGLDLVAKSAALGKVRTAVCCPGGLSDQAVRDGLRQGKSFVTDGPAMIFGLDGDGDGSIGGPADAAIGDGPVSVAINDPLARFRFFWNSAPEIGEVVCLRLYRGDSSTGENPALVWEASPNSYAGELAGPLAAAVLPAPGATVYYRAVGYTYDPAGAIPPPGDVSNYSYDAVANDYAYRCFANPIWITAAPALPTPTLTATATATTTATATLTPTATPTVTRTLTIPLTETPTGTVTPALTPTGSSTPTPTSTEPAPVPSTDGAGLVLMVALFSSLLLGGSARTAGRRAPR